MEQSENGDVINIMTCNNTEN